VRRSNSVAVASLHPCGSGKSRPGPDDKRWTLRQRLRAADLSHQRTGSWKCRPDVDFAEKAQRVLGLYRAKPDDGVVVRFDEMGPIQLIPHHGSGRAPANRPERLRATYSKNGRVRYLFGAYKPVHLQALRMPEEDSNPARG
jgi:hypothetical protein